MLTQRLLQRNSDEEACCRRLVGIVAFIYKQL